MAAEIASNVINSVIIPLEAGVRFWHTCSRGTSPDSNRWISGYLFSPSNFCTTDLSHENIGGKVFTTGNLMVDVQRFVKNCNIERTFWIYSARISFIGIPRPEKVDNPQNLRLLMNHIASTEYPVIFTVHPITKKNLQNFDTVVPSNKTLIDPQR